MTNRGLRTLGATAVGVSLFFIIAQTVLTPPSPTQAAQSDRTITIPGELFKGSEDAKAKKRFDEVMELFTDRYWRVLNAEEVFRKMISGGLTSLDPHTRIMDAKEYAEMQTQTRGEFGGVGIELQMNTGGPEGLLVVSPIDDTPAARAGIKPRDVIVRIDEKLVAGMSLQKSVEAMRGEPGTTVTILVIREGMREPLSFTLTRAVIKLQYVKYELKENGIGYIRITSFSGERVARDVLNAVAELEKRNNRTKLSGLVLDLRNNPGGLLPEAEIVSDLFLNARSLRTTGVLRPDVSELTIISKEARGRIIPEYNVDEAARGEIAGGVPIVVLINDGSASASEIVAKALQVYGRATIAGPAKSFGKGTIQGLVPLETGGALLITIAQYLVGPRGCERPVQNDGVTPDIFLKNDDERASSKVREEELPDSIARSDKRSASCDYAFALPDGHKEAARAILEGLGYTIVPKEETR